MHDSLEFCQKGDLKSENFVCNFEDGDTEVCTVKSWSASAEGLRLFAVRLSSLSQGKCGVCGITFDIFTHVSTGAFLFLVFWFSNWKSFLLSFYLQFYVTKFLLQVAILLTIVSSSLL